MLGCRTGKSSWSGPIVSNVSVVVAARSRFALL